MERLHLPAYYAALPEAEQRTIDGGGELKTAADDFFGNLHIDGFSLHKSFFSISFTFVPFLLFNLIRVGFVTARGISGGTNKLFKRTGQLGTKVVDFAASVTDPAPRPR